MNSEYIILNETNGSSDSEECVKDPVLLSKNLNQLMKKLKGENYLDESSIDYARLCQSDLYNKDYKVLSNQLKQIDLDKLLNSTTSQNDDNILAFFINIYNALTIHSLAYLSTKSSGDVPEGNLLSQLGGKFWSKMAYVIGNQNLVFSLDDIEHGILRSNRIHPTSKKKFFRSTDQRLKYSVEKFEPRIHFALNCGAKGCPPISFYTTENLERGLKMATTNFITNETNLISEKKTVELSKLLLWYKSDFIDNESQCNKTPDQLLLEFVYENLRENDEKKSGLKVMMSSYEPAVTFAAYDWEINAKK